MHSGSQFEMCCRYWLSSGRFWSRSMICSGSTRPRLPRSRSRGGGSRGVRCCCCWPGGLRLVCRYRSSSERFRRANLNRLSLGPLSVGALHEVLRDRLDRVFARQTLLRIHEQSGGNPFYALEIAAALDAQVDPTKPLPVPQSLTELVRGRVVRFAGSHAGGARTRRDGRRSVGVAARACRRRQRGARPSHRSRCDRAQPWASPLHTSVAGLGGLRRAPPRAAGRGCRRPIDTLTAPGAVV